MTIEHTILGLLSIKPMSGYDLKMIMQDSGFMYWSGNNNQIYKALTRLCDTGLVAITIEHRDNAPLLKRYSVTESGRTFLLDGIRQSEGLPEGKKPFLLRLAFAHGLSRAELHSMVDAYQKELDSYILMCESNAKQAFAPSRTRREEVLWQLINDNITNVYRQERDWLSGIRDVLDRYPDEEEHLHAKAAEDAPIDEEDLNAFPIEIAGQRLIYLPPDGRLIYAEQDALNCVELCLAHATSLLLISGERLSKRFIRLHSGIAGAVTQKLSQYRIRTAIIYDMEKATGKFRDYLLESNRGNDLHVFTTREEAEAWLLSATDK